MSYKTGVRKTSAIASCIAAATPVALYNLSAGRTCTPKKIHVHNGNPANTIVQIGTGLGGLFAQQIANILCVPGMDLEMREEDIVGVEFTANITVQATVAAAAPNNVTVQVEVEEYQGPTG